MINIPPANALGKSFPGFFISPTIGVTFIQPSYANSIAIKTEPKTVPVLSPGPTIGVNIGFVPLPLINANIAMKIRGITLPIVANV